MRKLALFAGLVAILIVAVGCDTTDPVTSPAVPHDRADGRVIGTIQGTVTDGANQALLEGVEVTTTFKGAHISTLTDATGHYAFTGVDQNNCEIGSGRACNHVPGILFMARRISYNEFSSWSFKIPVGNINSYALFTF